MDKNFKIAIQWKGRSKKQVAAAISFAVLLLILTNPIIFWMLFAGCGPGEPLLVNVRSRDDGRLVMDFIQINRPQDTLIVTQLNEDGSPNHDFWHIYARASNEDKNFKETIVYGQVPQDWEERSPAQAIVRDKFYSAAQKIIYADKRGRYELLGNSYDVTAERIKKFRRDKDKNFFARLFGF